MFSRCLDDAHTVAIASVVRGYRRLPSIADSHNCPVGDARALAQGGFRCYWRWKSCPPGGRPQIDTENFVTGDPINLDSISQLIVMLFETGASAFGFNNGSSNRARQNPPFLRLKRDEVEQQFVFRPHDAQFFRIDFAMLGERAKIIAPIAAALGPRTLAGDPGKDLDRLGGDGWPPSVYR